jgi:hypothetical protein
LHGNNWEQQQKKGVFWAVRAEIVINRTGLEFSYLVESRKLVVGQSLACKNVGTEVEDVVGQGTAGEDTAD